MVRPRGSALPNCARGLFGLLAAVPELPVKEAYAALAASRLFDCSACDSAWKLCWRCCQAAAPLWLLALADEIPEEMRIPIFISLASALRLTAGRRGGSAVAELRHHP